MCFGIVPDMTRSSVHSSSGHQTTVNTATPSPTAHMEMGVDACALLKNFGLCIIHVMYRGVPFLSGRKGKHLRCSCAVKTFHAAFLPFNFQLGRAKCIIVSAIQCVCIGSRAIHGDRACCQQMTNSLKYAITLSISCSVIVFLNCGENGPGKFNCYGLFLIRP